MIAAREYLRVSRDTSSRERSIDEQHEDNARAAESLSWQLGEAYRDQGSASRHARKRRGAFDQLLADLDADAFGADLLVLWESSRGSRRVSEWVQLIELCELREVRIAVTTHGPRVYDPSNPRDRRSLLEDAVDSEYEAAKLSKRVVRSSAADAEAGRWHGRVPFGYRGVYDPHTGRVLGREIHPVEGAVVSELFERLDRGHSLAAIARDFAARGITGRQGSTLYPETLRPMALRETYAGVRVHAAGVRDEAVRDRIGKRYAAQWDPIVSRELYLSVRRRLTDPARRTSRPGSGVHLLSMIARCGCCGEVLTARVKRDERKYCCRARSGCVTISADDLDAWATEAALAYFERPEHSAYLTADVDSDEIENAREAVATIQAELDELADLVGRGALSASTAARAEPAIVARLSQAQAALAELATPSALRGQLDVTRSIPAQWDELPMSTRREVVRWLFDDEGGRLPTLRVAALPRSRPGGTRRKVPVGDRIIDAREVAA